VNVDRATGGKQFPELSISMSGEFYHNTSENDSQAWVRVRQSSDTAELREFLRQYPQSFLAADARTRIATLEAEHATQELARRESREQTERLDRERPAREQAARDKVEQEAAAREAAGRLAKIEEDRSLRERTEQEKAERNRVTRDEAERTKVEVPMAMLTLPPDPPKSASSLVPGLSGSALILEIKRELKRIGCYTGRIDDKWITADTRASVQKFIRRASFASLTDEPTERFLDAVRAKSDRVCPLECGAREVARDGQCVAKSCSGGDSINRDGECVPRPEPKVKRQYIADTMPRQRPIESSSPARPNCHGFGQRQCRWFLAHPVLQ
jgi:hypothetical protein